MAFPLEAVPNFSEGRDRGAIDALASAIAGHAELLDVHSDADHNRSVFTLVGDERQVVEALLAGIACARDRIDLREHEGLIRASASRTSCPSCRSGPRTARALGRERARWRGGWARTSGSVFLYAELAPGRGPAFFRPRRTGGAPATDRRRGARAGFRAGAARPRAGGVVVVARPLIAFNVNLRGEVEAAREIAASVPERGGGVPRCPRARARPAARGVTSR